MKVQQQGEVRIQEVKTLPDGLIPFNEKTEDGKNFIISHSESGHHHVLPVGDVDVMERPLPPEFGEGARVLYAIVKNPTQMRQTANAPHEAANMATGFHMLTISMEVDPFTKQARRVAD